MGTPQKREDRKHQIQELLDQFSWRFLPCELSVFVNELWCRVLQEPALVIARGKPENWASAVVYVIAQLNYLFIPGEGELLLTEDGVCEFFGTKKRTALDKSELIADALGIQMGEPGLCAPESVQRFSKLKALAAMRKERAALERRRRFRVMR